MNIFEGITKEEFIEEFNKEGNGSLSLLHINLAFDYKLLKKKKVYRGIDNKVALRSITNITNYIEEIEFFNSFKPFVEFNGNPVLIVGNYNKYLSSRNKLNNKLEIEYSYVVVENLYMLRKDRDNTTVYRNSEGKYIVFSSVMAFNKSINYNGLEKYRDSLVIELTKLEIEKKDKILSVLNYRFLNFSDKGYKMEFDIQFKKFNLLKTKKDLSKKDFIVDGIFDEFIISVDDKDDYLYYYLIELRGNKTLDLYSELITDMLENMQLVAEYLNYDVRLIDLLNYNFKR